MKNLLIRLYMLYLCLSFISNKFNLQININISFICDEIGQILFKNISRDFVYI
jgi:hypothetical protein